MEQHTAEEWEKIIGNYMRDATDVPTEEEWYENEETTKGFYEWNKHNNGQWSSNSNWTSSWVTNNHPLRRGLYEQNSSQQNTGYTQDGSIPAPIQNQVTQPATQVPVQQTPVQQPVMQQPAAPMQQQPNFESPVNYNNQRD